MARLRGVSLFTPGHEVEAGPAVKGEYRRVPVTVENLTGRDLQIVGGTSSCACVATGDLPLVVPAHGSATAEVEIKYTGEPGRFKHTFLWYTDAPNQPRLTGTVAGQVLAAGPSS